MGKYNYNQQEIVIIAGGSRQGVELSKLEQMLRNAGFSRTQWSIARRARSMYWNNSSLCDEGLIAKYLMDAQVLQDVTYARRRQGASTTEPRLVEKDRSIRKTNLLIQSIQDPGYEIAEPQFIDGSLRVPIVEENFDRRQAVVDFETSINEALQRMGYRLMFTLYIEKSSIIIIPVRSNDPIQVRQFLEDFSSGLMYHKSRTQR